MESKKFKFTTICFDGIDKTGKDSIAKYIDQVVYAKYLVRARGIMTLIAYSELYYRNYDYNLDGEVSTLNILLTCNKEDWKYRCKMTGEKEIDFDSNQEVFDKAYYKLLEAGCHVLKFNTSDITPFEIAKQIVNYLKLQGEPLE